MAVGPGHSELTLGGPSRLRSARGLPGAHRPRMPRLEKGPGTRPGQLIREAKRLGNGPGVMPGTGESHRRGSSVAWLPRATTMLQSSIWGPLLDRPERICHTGAPIAAGKRSWPERRQGDDRLPQHQRPARCPIWPPPGAGRADQCCAHATCSVRPGRWGGLVTQPCESAHAHGAFVGKMGRARDSRRAVPLDYYAGSRPN